MKKLKLFIASAVIGLASYLLWADSIDYGNLGYNAEIINETALGVAKTVVVDTNKEGINRISAQIIASTATVSSVTLYDGKQSTMQVTITDNAALSSAVARGGFAIKSNSALSPAYAKNILGISSNSALAGTYAFNTIKITSMSALENSTITVNDENFREGIEWSVLSSSMLTTLCISTAIATSDYVEITSAGVGGLDIIELIAKWPYLGSVGNSFDLTSSTPTAMTVSYSSFTNGFDNAHFSVNGTSFTQGVDWTCDTAYATNTAVSILDALEEDKDLADLISFKVYFSTNILMTAISPGTDGNDYTLKVSTKNGLSVTGATFDGGTDHARASFGIRGSSFTEGMHWGAKSLSSETATSIAYAINRSSLSVGVEAEAIGSIIFTTPIAVVRSSNGVITSNPKLWGTVPNSWTLTVSTGALLSSGTFTGGRDRATLIVNKSRFRNGLEWYSDSRAANLSFSSHTARSLVDAINSESTNTLVFADCSSGTYASNTVTITSMTALENSTLTVNDINLREGIEWNVMPSSMETTICLSTAIASVSNVAITSAGVGGLDIITCYVSLLSPVGDDYDMTSSTPAAMAVSNSSFTGGKYSVVWTTSIYINKPYEFYTSTQGALTISSYSVLNSTLGSAVGYMQGGFDSDISTTTNLISKSNSFSSGLPVLYSSNTTTGLKGLIHQTTYYIKSPTKSSFYLSDTSTGSVASTTQTIVSVGDYYTIISTGGGSYTLAPWLFKGVSSMTWQVSNDGVNYKMTPHSVAITSSTSKDSAYFWDMGEVNYRWLKLNIATPTISGGGVDIRATINGKR